MKIHNQSIKRFMGISAATLLLLSVGGSAINTTNHNTHADVSLDSIMKAQDKKSPTKSDIAQEKEDYNYALTDAQKHPKHLSNDELGMQDNYLFHKKSFERAVKQGIKQRNHRKDDTFTKFVKTMSNQGPTKSDIADEQEQYNNVLKDSIKHPKEMKANETILQDNSLFHKKSFEQAVKQGIHKRTSGTKQAHKIKRSKWKQVKAIRKSLKQINRKINKIAHHKYRTKRTKRNARRTLNHLKRQLRNNNKQLNQLTHKHSTKQHKKVRKHNGKRYKRHAKKRK